MKATQKELQSSSKTTPATIQKKNTAPPVSPMEQVINKIAVLQEDIHNLNKLGRATIIAEDGVLIVAFSIPGIELGVIDTDSGRMITINGKAVI